MSKMIKINTRAKKVAAGRGDVIVRQPTGREAWTEESFLFSLFFVFYGRLMLDVCVMFRQNPPSRQFSARESAAFRHGVLHPEARPGRTALMWFRICILVAVSVPSTASWARDIYVNNSLGDDRNDGSAAVVAGVRIGPYRTLSRALAATHTGDRVHVANTGEPYRESITLQGARQSGFPDAPFELVGNGAMLDGSQPVPPDAWSYVEGNLFRFRPPKTAFQMLYLDGKPVRRREAWSPDDLGISNRSNGVSTSSTSIFVARRTGNRSPMPCLVQECRLASHCTRCGTSL